MSNTLKLYLREIRNKQSLVSSSLEEIVDRQKVMVSVKEFMSNLNKHLPPNKNYVSLGEVKRLIEGKKMGKTFGRILKESLIDFTKTKFTNWK